MEVQSHHMSTTAGHVAAEGNKQAGRGYYSSEQRVERMTPKSKSDQHIEMSLLETLGREELG